MENHFLYAVDAVKHGATLTHIIKAGVKTSLDVIEVRLAPDRGAGPARDWSRLEVVGLAPGRYPGHIERRRIRHGTDAGISAVVWCIRDWRTETACRSNYYFQGKPVSLDRLLELVEPFDVETEPWWDEFIV